MKKKEIKKHKQINWTYCIIDDTTGHSKLHSPTEFDLLSRYIILSHQAGILFFSPESYPVVAHIYN